MTDLEFYFNNFIATVCAHFRLGRFVETFWSSTNNEMVMCTFRCIYFIFLIRNGMIFFK
jgi:hypothetical protein